MIVYMKMLFIWCLLVFPLSQFDIAAQAPLSKTVKKNLSGLEEFHRRGGLDHVFYQTDTSRFVRIAYLGGSITEAAGGWRELTFSWFRLTYPQTIFVQVNAGIGGTGSDLGAFRVEDEVLKQGPDLLFVEFAVNDASRSREDVIRSMEGIVRKVRKNNPYTDICFVYTVTEAQCDLLLEGKLHSTVMAMEELAGHYGIPSIHMGICVARLLAEGKLLFTAPQSKNATSIVFTQDKVHPLPESGHPLYAAAVTKYLGKMKQGKKPVPYSLPAPLMDDNWQDARMVAVDDVDKQGNWVKITADDPVFKGFLPRLPGIYMGSAGSKLKFRFKGTTLGLYDVIGPGTGALRITIDGTGHTVQRFDRYCTYWRLANTIVLDKLDNTEHDVEIEVLHPGLDKKKILTDANLEKYQKNQAAYKDENFYIGRLLLVGNLL